MNNNLEMLNKCEILNYYNEIYSEYMKTKLVYDEVKDILYEYGIKFFDDNKLNYLEEKYICIKNLLISEKINIPCDNDNISYTVEDIISVINNICNKEIEWIQENSFIYDYEADSDYFGIDIDYYFDNYGDECLSNLIINAKIKLYNKIIEDIKEKYSNNDTLVRKLELE